MLPLLLLLLLLLLYLVLLGLLLLLVWLLPWFKVLFHARLYRCSSPAMGVYAPSNAIREHTENHR